jgi:cytochrome c biogenesis protein CcmG, thiol:disulfide interchange protein DsbE
VRKVLASLVLMMLVAGCDRGQHPEQVNKAAPSFSVSDGTNSADLAKLRGKVVLLNFWASTCVPCIEEIPSLEELQRRMPQLAVVAISMDEDRDAYQHFLDKYHIGLHTIWDEKQSVNPLYGTYRYPETYVIDRNGMLRRKFIGPQTWTSPEIMEYLAKL